MAKRKKKITHAEIVRVFGDRLREVRHSRGMTQSQLADKAHLTASYVWRLESAGAAAGIDVVGRLAEALGTTAADLLPTSNPPDTVAVLREQARELFNGLMQSADQQTLQEFLPVLARFAESSARTR